MKKRSKSVNKYLDKTFKKFKSKNFKLKFKDTYLYKFITLFNY